MIKTLTDVAGKSYNTVASVAREKWLEQDPSQITLLVNNIIWSGKVEACLKQIADSTDINALKKFFDKSVELLTNLIKMVQGELTRPMRQKIMCLITMDTHSRDVIDKLIQ
jgi:dynein heavy chain